MTMSDFIPYPLAFVMRCRVREALATRSMVGANTERIIRQTSKSREGEQVFPSLSYMKEKNMDSGYASFQDPRLIPPDVDEPEREDKPLTHELRERLDRLDIDYSCGWHMSDGNHINVDDVTHVLIGDGRMVTVVEEVTDVSHLYLDIEEFTSFTPQEIAAMMGALRR